MRIQTTHLIQELLDLIDREGDIILNAHYAPYPEKIDQVCPICGGDLSPPILNDETFSMEKKCYDCNSVYNIEAIIDSQTTGV